MLCPVLRNQQCTDRRGAALVEFSLVLPLMLMLLIGSIEVGRGINVRHTLSEAARAGARIYSLKKRKTEADARAAIAQVMKEGKLNEYTVTFDPDPLLPVVQSEPVTVTVAVRSEDALWNSSPWFMKGRTISSTCVMPVDLGEKAADTSGAGDGSSAPDVFDTDDTGEGSGVSDKELEKLQKEAQKLKEKAQKAQDKADKEAAKAAEKQAEADAAAKKAAQEGTKQAEKDAEKAQDKADSAAEKANEKAQEAADAWKEANDAAALVQLYSAIIVTPIELEFA